MVRRMSAVTERGFLDEVMSREGLVEPGRLSGVLRVTKGELATQARLREVAEIINRILPWCGSVPQAFAWYRSQPIPAFGDQTAEDMVRAGRAEHLKSYLAGIAIGGYA